MPFECRLCPRNCGVDRETRLGFCLVPNDYLVARAAPHLWEEPILSGTHGSGTIFFSGCTMACCFCQNRPISRNAHGTTLTSTELAEIMLNLQDQGCHNINLVTADHYLHRLGETVALAKAQGLHIPIALNTSSYIKSESLKPLTGLIDIYLPDLKYFADRYAVRYSQAPNYFAVATAAIAEMYRQTGPAVVTDSLMQSGVMIRHLALPTLFFDSKKVIRYIHSTYGNNVYFSLMNQYTPLYDATKHPEINRPLSSHEYESLLDFCDSLDIEFGFSQDALADGGDGEGGLATTEGRRTNDETFYIPQFDGTGTHVSATANEARAIPADAADAADVVKQ